MENLSLNSGFLPKDDGFATRAIHVAQNPDDHSFGPIVTPMYSSVNYKQYGPDENRGYIYGRTDNPTRNCFEEVLASLEQAKFAIAFGSGVAAAAAVTELLTVGDHILRGDDVFGGTIRCFNEITSNHGIETTSADTTDMDALVKAIKPNTKMLYIESPTNPTLQVTDIPKVKETLGKINPNIIIVVDNTFLTPYFQKPLQLGADVTLYSATKYLNGHSDVIMGALTTNREDLYKKLNLIQRGAGPIPSPRDCWMMVRSLKTLAIRMEQHMNNGMQVANFLEQHPLIERVVYPGLKSHPQHEVAKRMFSGVSGMMGVYVKGDIEICCRVVASLKVFCHAGSLGSNDSVVVMPWTMTHANVPIPERLKLGITPNYIRVSIGIESAKDLMADFDQALKAANVPDPSGKKLSGPGVFSYRS